jgi:hypothetical protein
MLSEAATRFAARRDMSRFVSLSVAEDGLRAWLHLHPAEEPLDLALDAGDVVLTAKTSSCGPGYHAYVIDYMDFVAAELATSWRGCEDEGDETGYFERRDFGALQGAMVDWLRAVAESVVGTLEREHFSCVSLSLDIGRQIQPPSDEAATPLGFRSLAFFKSCMAAKEADHGEIGQAWFIWWDRACDARFWLKSGLNMMWVEAPWRPPFADEDARINADVEHCIANATRLDGDSPIPKSDLDEMRRLRDSDDEWLSPNSDGIGYLRRPLRRPFPGNWTAIVPGFWRAAHNESDSTYWHKEITVQGSSFKVTNTSGRPFRIDELLDTEKYEVERQIGDDYAFAIMEKTFDHEGRQQPWIFGKIARYQHVFMLSVFLTDESQIEYAKDIIRSARYTGPDEAPHQSAGTIP